MSELFNPVPDWFSFENQGGNVATIDLDNDGHLELLVCAIDHPTPGPNRGLYRVGKKLNRDGLVAGGWGLWMDIPNWFSFENQGCAIAVADLNANGRPDLVVFTVDHRVPGPNRGIFQVGRDLDANGNVTGGWTGWIDVANWFSWDNQGAAIALTQLGPGRSWDLVVFTIDRRVPGPNRGIYQVGKSIDANGQVHGGWGGWIDIDWFSWENQGVGIAFHDLDGNGRPELIAFQIDNPPQLNSGQYRIGWNIDTDGVPNDGWGRWNIIPGWESWDNQGGGISVGDFDGTGRPQLLVFQIDNPVGPNRGLYRRVVLENDLNDAAQKGTWRLLPYLSQVLPVHAGLLHTGKVLFFAGSGNSFVRSDSPWFGNLNAGIYTSVLWDFAKGNAFNHPPTAFDGNGKVLDFFCGGHAFLSDGRLLVAGGTLVYDHHNPKNEFQGRRETLIFDPATEKWKQAASMKDGRWYPTLISLADGRVLAATGLNSAVDSRINPLLEIFDPRTGGWVEVGKAELPLYAHLFPLQDGSVFYAGGQMSGNGGITPRILDLASNPIRVTAVPGLQTPDTRNQSASVFLPPVQDQRVMIIGGGAENDDDPQKATNVVDIVDLKVAHPAYQNSASLNLHFRRMHVNAVLLPDRTVLATGGSGKREDPALATLDCEIFDPNMRNWSLAAEAMIPRMYHSIALLLPDGRVVAAGSNPDKGSQANWVPADRLEELRLEIYSPPYLFKGKRPAITNAPAQVTLGEAFTVLTPDARSIQWISLIRPGLTTHSFNCEQRLADVPFQVGQETNSLSATMPKDPHIVPPGWYMLFLANRQGIPSVASWVHISSGG